MLLIRKELSSILPDRWCCCGGELVTVSNVTASAESIFCVVECYCLFEMTSIALVKDEMNALEEWLENSRPPCCNGS